jgi:hypothetical protein
MRVNIYETVEVSDADRKLIAERLGQKNATRDDLKAFIWYYGAQWQNELRPADDDRTGEAEMAAAVQRYNEGFTEDEANVNGVGDEGDLIGGPSAEVRAEIAANDAKYEAALAAAHENLRELNAEDLI